MSVRINAAGTGLSRTANLPASTNFTFCARVMISVDRNDVQNIFQLDDNAAGGNNIGLETDSNGTTLGVWNNSTFSTFSASPQVGRWFFLVLKSDASNYFARWSYGLGDAFRTLQGTALNITTARLTLGFDPDTVNNGNQWLNGRFANVMCWNRLVSDSELLVQSIRFKPVSREALNFWWELKRSDLARDVGPNRRDPTISGTLITEQDLLLADQLRRPPRVVFLAGGSISLTVDDATHGHAVGALDLTQAHVLSVDEAIHSNAAESPTLTIAFTLAPDDALHGNIVDSPSLTQANLLAVNDAAHANLAESVALIQAHVLAIADALHTQAVESPTLIVSGAISVQDALHSNIADAPVLIQAHILSVDDAAHAHTVENITLSQSVLLAVAEALHGHAADGVTLTQGHVLAVASALHLHATDAVDLTQANVVVVVSDTLHSQLVDALALQLPSSGPPPKRIVVVKAKSRTVIVAPSSRVITVN